MSIHRYRLIDILIAFRDLQVRYFLSGERFIPSTRKTDERELEGFIMIRGIVSLMAVAEVSSWLIDNTSPHQ